MDPSTTKSTILSPSAIEELVNDGATLVIYGKAVLKLDSWLRYHPGGEKTILHMVGRDATDQINAFHSVETQKSMERFQIGRIEGKWDNIIPLFQRASDGKNILEIGQHGDRDEENSESSACSRASSVFETNGLRSRAAGTESPASSISASSEDISKLATDALAPESKGDVERDEDAIVASFRELVAQIEAQGLYDCNYWAYLTDVIRISIIFSIMLLLLHFKQYILSSIALGTFWHQLVFIAHDSGHLGITHNYTIDTAIGLLLSSTLGGLSLSWWKTSHNVHHLATNSPSHDPDIQHLPFLAVTPSFFSSLYSTYYSRIMPYTPFASTMMRFQHHLYYPLLCFGRFNLYFLSWTHLYQNLGPKHPSMRWHRPLEILGQLTFWYWFGYLLLYHSLPTLSSRVLFVVISHAVTMPLHVQFTLSHFAMSAKAGERNESWVRQQLRTTMDVDCPAWMDWFHGGLQFQAIHHLFPRLPRHNLRRASEVVKVWAAENGVRYEVYGFVECNGRVLGRLEEVGRQAGFLREATRSVVEKGEWLRGEWE
ncbi:fatty acid desaturase [Mollisia scopiformis]|uniref:Delta 8-(E)-sphingolipid desaturase n=1 Tax=Mollisia scopiformis TaxID=149040 RepID=A0A194XKK4_MOLSC|nr:fatty acid desaturase [Mollisia scopiformis]KUJ20639.1 fatty acid desaturase [Mollisia scopiformis]